MNSLKLQQKIRTQKGLILKEMALEPRRWFLISHFCGIAEHCFVGYKAPTRIAELQQEGYLISRWSDLETSLGNKLKEYRLSPNYKAEFEDDKICLYEKTEAETRQTLSPNYKI